VRQGELSRFQQRKQRAHYDCNSDQGPSEYVSWTIRAQPRVEKRPPPKQGDHPAPAARRDPRLITRALDIALRTIFSLQRRRARRARARAPRTGAVTFVQRFGGALNLNVHFHCVIPDGVFVRDGEGTPFLALSGPSDAEVQEVLGRIVRRLRKLVRPRLEVAQADARVPDALATAQADSLSLLRGNPPPAVRIKRQAAYLEGFSLHAGVHLHANDREGSRICAAMVPGRRRRRIVSRSFPMADSPIG
jgi:hypothetical protein